MYLRRTVAWNEFGTHIWSLAITNIPHDIHCAHLLIRSLPRDELIQHDLYPTTNNQASSSNANLNPSNWFLTYRVRVNICFDRVLLIIKHFRCHPMLIFTNKKQQNINNQANKINLKEITILMYYSLLTKVPRTWVISSFDSVRANPKSAILML